MKKQKTEAKINLEALAGGAFAEKLNEALMQLGHKIPRADRDTLGHESDPAHMEQPLHERRSA